MKVVEYISYLVLPMLILTIIFYGEKKKISTYDTFIEGTKEGFQVITRIFPTMLSVVVAINLFKISGAMELFVRCISPIITRLNVPGEVIPLGIMRSVSGGGAIAILSDTLKENGPDSMVGRIASTIMGSSDTTLYVLAIYAGAVGIKKTRGALWIGLTCDFIAFMVAILLWQK
ncbi:MAG: spore maturation protein [Clostridia bacterium]|nr:spore maturation protein [Clostridia bacterium]